MSRLYFFIASILIGVSITAGACSCEKRDVPVEEDDTESTDPEDGTGDPELSGLKLEINSITPTSVTFSLTRDNPDMAYLLGILSKEDFQENGYDDPESLWNSDLERFREEAQIYDETLEQTIMNHYAKTEDLTEETFGNLEISTDYVIYAYGLKVCGDQAELLTAIHTASFTTTEIEMKDLRFDIETDVIRARATISIAPVDYSGPYYADVSVGSQSPEQATLTGHQSWNLLREELQMYGYTTEDILREFCIHGPRTAEWNLNADTDYTVYAFAIDPQTALPCSDASSETFRTGIIPPSDNRISIEISDIKARSFNVTATPTNNDPYFSATVRSSELEGFSDEEIISFMMYNFTDNTVSGGFTETVRQLDPDTDYSVVMFGLEGGIPTTGLFRENATTLSSNDLETVIEILPEEHYDIAAAAELDPSIKDYLSYGDAFLHLRIRTEPEDIPAYICYFNVISLDYYEGIGVDLTDDFIINTLLLEGAQSYKDKMIGINYGERMFGAAVIMDEAGNVGPLFKTEVFTRDISGASDPHGLLEWLKSPYNR